MGKKDKGPAPGADAIRSLFSADNPFRRKPSTEDPPAPTPPPPAPAAATPLGKHPKPDATGVTQPSSKKKKGKELEEGPPRRKRKREELAPGGEKPALSAAAEQPLAVGAKRKAPDDAAAAAAGAGEEEDEDAFDDESKLLRTIFVGNLPLRTKRKALTKEFAAFGQVESVRIRSVPISDVSAVAFLLSSLFDSRWNGLTIVSLCLLQTKIPRKGAIMKGMINESLDK
jgi:nucleolar protein 12